MAKDIKKLKNVQAGDVLYKLDKEDLENGVSEITVNNVTSNYNGYVIFETSEGTYFSPPKSAMSSQFFWSNGKTVIGTSKEAVLKASEKMLKKMLDKTDLNIAELKGRLNNLIEKRKEIYRLCLDTFTISE